MKKIDYNIVYTQSDIYFGKATMAKTLQESAEWFDMYHEYITACGWTSQELDAETLKRVDNSWEEKDVSN